MSSAPFFLDSNILITAKNVTYPFDVFPPFWDLMADFITSSEDEVRILDVVRDEILCGKDELADWFKKLDIPIIRVSQDQAIVNAYAEVASHVYSIPVYKQAVKDSWFLDRTVADPWLIAAALAYDGTIVTLETQKKPDAKKRLLIPNIASAFDVECIDAVKMLRLFNRHL